MLKLLLARLLVLMMAIDTVSGADLSWDTRERQVRQEMSVKSRLPLL